MMSTTLARPKSYADIVETPDDGLRYEIIAGEMFASPSCWFHHQEVLARLITILSDHVEDRDLGRVLLGPFDVLLAAHDCVAPDAVFLSTDRRRFLTFANLKGPPDLIVEVTAPWTIERDLGSKRELYAWSGVREYWCPDPDARTFVAFANDEGDSQVIEHDGASFASRVLPGLIIDLVALFDDLYPWKNGG